MKIGILGGGQLSRMLALSGIPLGFEFIFYTQKNNSVKNLGEIFYGEYNNYKALETFAAQCDIITYENENIPIETLEFLENIKPIHPNSLSLKITQDRFLEKTMFQQLEIPCPIYKKTETLKDVLNFSNQYGYPFIIKKRKNGYDGKGLIKISDKTSLSNLSTDFLKNTICEENIPFHREFSIIAVSSATEQRYYDLCENQHNNGILITTFNRINDPMFELAKIYIDRVIKHLSYVGCMAFEFFQVNDKLFANEIAPRVHNSGHWTIEGAFTSQFENHIRAISGLPLGNTHSRCHTKMINIIGNMINKKEILMKDFCHLHDYKKEEKPGRKIGHVTMIIDES